MKKGIVAIVLSVSVMICGCSNKTPKNEVPTPNANNATQKSTGESNIPQVTPQLTPENKNTTPQQRSFTLDELKKYNGQNEGLAYVAVDGVVYDVTKINKWKNGKHEGVVAGSDISKAINSSPHGKNILKDVPVVGNLK